MHTRKGLGFCRNLQHFREILMAYLCATWQLTSAKCVWPLVHNVAAASNVALQQDCKALHGEIKKLPAELDYTLERFDMIHQEVTSLCASHS